MSGRAELDREKSYAAGSVGGAGGGEEVAAKPGMCSRVVSGACEGTGYR